MLKHSITYDDFDGNSVTEDFYFNLSFSELMEMSVEEEGGLRTLLEKIIESEDKHSILKGFKRIVLSAYGIKSEDGTRFIKSDELSTHFSQTAAYDALFTELTTDEVRAANFINGVIPKDFMARAKAMEGKAKQNAPTPPPLPPAK